MSKNILIADDDAHIREVIQFALEKSGFRTEMADNGKAALALLKHDRIDLVILDISMPEMDGLEVCRQLRKTSELPILFLSSRDEEIDRIIGLELGGDDYLSKPFSPRELVARVQAVLKRLSRSITPPLARHLQKGSLRVDIESYTAYWQNDVIPLTATEFMLLSTLLQHPNKVYTREQLMDQAYSGLTVSDRTIDSHMRRIRQKFLQVGAQNVAETVHGIGYKLGTCT
jgi:two-component system, OmpR family, response regulator